jgi:PAS domain S-box-containing protein
MAAAAVSAALMIYLVPSWHSPSARNLLLLMGSVAIWSFAYGMEFRSTGLAAKLGWVQTEYLGAAWTGVLFFRFAMSLTGRRSVVTNGIHRILFIVPLLTILAVYTNEHHHLIWADAWIDTTRPVPVLAYRRGIGFWCFVAYSYSLLLAGTMHLLHGYLFTRRIENRHFWVMLIGVSAPWASNIIYLAGIEPMDHIDLTPMAFTISGVAFFWGTIRHQMLTLIPIAREAVIESMQDAVFVLDRSNRVVDVNSTARRLLPAATMRIIGKSLTDIYPALADRVQHSREHGCRDLSLTLADRAATGVWRLRQSPLYGLGAVPVGWLVILQDITEQQRQETALRESEEKFRSISANALDAIVMIDPNGRVSFWNPAAEAMFGYREADILGRDLHARLVPAAYHARHKKAFDSFRHSGKGAVIGKIIEINCLHKSGRTFPAELSLSPLQIGGQWHAVGIVRDTTERKKTQNYIIQNEKMLSLGGLAAGMAHEINNPLAGILGNSQVIRMRLLGDLPSNARAAQDCGITLDQLRTYLDRRNVIGMIEAIEQSCQRAATIVRNMLDFSRKSHAIIDVHDLSSLLDRAVALADHDFQVANHFDFRKIRIQRNYPTETVRVPCDAARIQQVLLNILKNGAQAMWQMADRKHNPELRLGVYADATHGCVTIADNGPGMDEAVRRRIFEPFYTTKPSGSGTGLGLSVAYFIVNEHHQGHLDVASTPGKGTEFTIKLPLKPSA